jgi:methylated-DNA-protein-cysteine methyltransferase-like protein
MRRIAPGRPAAGGGPGGGLFGRIWAIVARIPRGRVATYSQVARLAGLPNGARTVGWAMAALPDRLAVAGRPVPWHRVVNVQGRISLGGDAALEQRARLRLEGIRVSLTGRLRLALHRWRPAAPRTAVPPARRPRRPRLRRRRAPRGH